MTIRLLTTDDIPAMEAVIDTRPYFQGQAVTDEWRASMKQTYIRARFRDNVWWFGYFSDDNELVGFREVHVSPFSPFDFISGATYTKAGKADARWQGSGWPQVVLELLNYAVAHFVDQKLVKTWWILGPLTPPKAGRLIEQPGAAFGDGTWTREQVGTVQVGTMTGDPFVDGWVLQGVPPMKDQVVFKFDKAGWVDPRLPKDAPPMGAKSSFDGVHPPRGDKPSEVHPPG